MKELGIASLLGDLLRERVDAIFEQQELTPAAASADLQPIADQLNQLDNALNQLLQSFEFFRIGTNELASGEFEVGFLIPRAEIDDSLGGLGKELMSLKRILGPFQELTTGTREDPQIRSVSSSDILILLQSHPATAALIAVAVERVIAAYEKVMNIRVAYKTLHDAGASEKTLSAVQGDADTKMQAEIKALVEELLTKVTNIDDRLVRVELDAARENELRKDLLEALNGIANRIDHGYTVEVRTGELPQPEDAEEPEQVNQRKAAEVVIARQDRLSFSNMSGAPILQLPEAALTTPTELATEIWGAHEGASRSAGSRRIRATARELFPKSAPGKGGEWELTEEQADLIRARVSE